jgi:quinol monooxygenase YgiN
MYMLINKITAKPGQREAAINIMLEAGKAFDSNDSCLMYALSADASDENVIWAQDAWTDEQSHQAAMANPTMQESVKAAMPLLEGMPEQFQVDLVGGKLPQGLEG